MNRYKITAWTLILSGWLLSSLAGAGRLPVIAGLPASFEDELPGAAVITLCADGRQLPVAMEKDYISLKTALMQDLLTGNVRVTTLLENMEGRS